MISIKNINIDAKSAKECSCVFLELEHFIIEGYLFETDVLFVTFEPAGVAQVNRSKYRAGWGENIFRSLGVSSLHIKANSSNWYLKPDLPAALTSLQPLFRSFDRVITYGGSMGGFGALTYADLIGAQTVISINPQSTLDQRIVPWEDRYPVAQERLLDFSHPHADAVGKYANAEQVLIFGDRRYDFDNAHVERLMAPNVTYVNTPYIEHQVPEHLMHMKALTYIVRSVLDDSFDLTRFYKLMRARRNLKRYFNVMAQKTASHPARAAVVERFKANYDLVGKD